LMKMAEKFGIPVLTLIDTPGAYPGLKRKNADKVRLSPEIYLKWSSKSYYYHYCW
jgi:acetyl-CoA carboxylase carboxyl transferase subunit alpha